MPPIRSKPLPNGVTIDFHDHSNRYFGDYHRVCITVECRIEIDASLFAGAADPLAELQKVRARLGPRLLVSRTLERMGVAGDDLPKVREALIDGYLQSALPYLSDPAFPGRLLAKELSGRRPSRALSLVRR